MNVSAPYGYEAIVPLRKEHRVLLPAGSTPVFCRRLNAIAVVVAEFVAALHDFPLVFITGDGGASFAPVAVLGLEDGQNLFVDAAGQWDPAAYVPAFVRRYPFCISKVYVDGKPSGERIVCVASAYLDPGGVALFAPDGGATSHWRPVEQLLGQYEAELDRTAAFCAALARLGLLAPFSMQAQASGIPASQLGGMYRVDEAKLAALKANSHKALVGKGYMGRIYAHLHSLENFARLNARRQRAAAARGFRAPPLTDGRG